VIETQRLLLRPLAIEDRDALIEIFADPEVEEFMSPFGPENADERLRSYRESWAQRGYGLMAVIDRGTGELIAAAFTTGLSSMRPSLVGCSAAIAGGAATPPRLGARASSGDFGNLTSPTSRR
jgi:hypothetical protein